MHRLFRIALIVAILLGVGLPTSARTARALTNTELKCQQTIGKEGAKYAKRREKALRGCAYAQARGDACDTAKRDKQIASAEAKLGQRLEQKCGDVALENLGFPGACSDGNGPPFAAQDLVACIRDSHLARVDMAVATEYPATHGTLDGAEINCQKTIGVEGERFIAAKLKYRAKCLDDQLKGKLDAAVNCRAQVPPNGAGTGDPKTDSRITKAVTKLRTKIDRKCSGVSLEDLGFPNMCDDPDGPPFSASNLEDCIEDTHEQKADEMVGFEYPGAAPATPTPVVTPSPDTPTPTGGGATATGGGGATPTATPTPSGSCVLPNPIPEVLSFVAKPGVDLDTGWTGISHDVPGVDDGAITAVRLSNCDLDTESPTCGQCDTEGPILFPGASKNCRCYDLADRDAQLVRELRSRDAVVVQRARDLRVLLRSAAADLVRCRPGVRDQPLRRAAHRDRQHLRCRPARGRRRRVRASRIERPQRAHRRSAVPDVRGRHDTP